MRWKPVLDDRDGLIELPRPGAPLRVAMGYKETVTLPMGLYSCDEVSVKGPPDTLTIRGARRRIWAARSRTGKPGSRDDITIGAIVETSAAEHARRARPPSTPAKHARQAQPGAQGGHRLQGRPARPSRPDRRERSELPHACRRGSRCHRRGEGRGALLFIGQAEGKSASGLTMPPRPLCKSARTSWSATLATRERFNTVEAFWHDRKAGARKTVTAGEGAPVKRLRHCCKDEAEARRAARARPDECRRGNDTFCDTFCVTLPGDPLIAAGGQIIAIGFRPGLDGLWSVKTTTHAHHRSWIHHQNQLRKSQGKGAIRHQTQCKIICSGPPRSAKVFSKPRHARMPPFGPY